MNIRGVLGLWLGLILASQSVVWANDTATQPVRIAIVNVATLLDNTPQSKAAEAKLKLDFVPREQKLAADQKQMQALEDDLALRNEAGSLPEDEKLQRQRELRDRQRKYSREMEDFREEVRAARDAAIDALQNGIIQAIGEVRAQEKIDLVLRESNYIVASDRIDITSKVMQHLEQKFQAQATLAPPAAAAPVVVPRKQE
ncbi:OmpH family outer membrane protein [Thiothrix fructosivorans]|uniref:OmpH family outer membrane protein n=1 Tax=Thiothrix fructosivorans TaxID=111770 RepID=A0A8B0SGK5_9GAMM|nr:OmpH family outer membrane protein [Thiothrix fructosivorans]MBO0614741.1 OmpH family outer membrane protein [Thiothrix fructosivorans]QTX09560.1 OmpH family outer membrane protein [Thiothrix fructosivorans]